MVVICEGVYGCFYEGLCCQVMAVIFECVCDIMSGYHVCDVTSICRWTDFIKKCVDFGLKRKHSNDQMHNDSFNMLLFYDYSKYMHIYPCATHQYIFIYAKYSSKVGGMQSK